MTGPATNVSECRPGSELRGSPRSSSSSCSLTSLVGTVATCGYCTCGYCGLNKLRGPSRRRAPLRRLRRFLRLPLHRPSSRGSPKRSASGFGMFRDLLRGEGVFCWFCLAAGHAPVAVLILRPFWSEQQAPLDFTLTPTASSAAWCSSACLAETPEETGRVRTPPKILWCRHQKRVHD